MNVGTPLLAALIICMTAGLVSAFASTTGILAALVPLAVPLATSGAVSDWALICALSVCASIVDVSPFSTTGATPVVIGDRRGTRADATMATVLLGPCPCSAHPACCLGISLLAAGRGVGKG